MITIVDYGLGNILAIVNLYKRLNIDVAVAKTADGLRGARKLILPGDISPPDRMVLVRFLSGIKTPGLAPCQCFSQLAGLSTVAGAADSSVAVEVQDPPCRHGGRSGGCPLSLQTLGPPVR